jgi:putative transcriptional regulator
MNEKVCNCVQQYRKKAGLTQEQLAVQAQVTRQTIIAIERGNYTPSVLLALRLSQALDTQVEALFNCK